MLAVNLTGNLLHSREAMKANRSGAIVNIAPYASYFAFPDIDRQRAGKREAVTDAGLVALRAALPLGIAIQARLFEDEGRPGGSLLAMLVAIDRHETTILMIVHPLA